MEKQEKGRWRTQGEKDPLSVAGNCCSLCAMDTNKPQKGTNWRTWAERQGFACQLNHFSANEEPNMCPKPHPHLRQTATCHKVPPSHYKRRKNVCTIANWQWSVRNEGLLAGNFDIFAKGMVAYERALWKSQRGLKNMREIVNRNSVITPNENIISEITPIV